MGYHVVLEASWIMLCNALKSKHEENEAIFLRFRLLARHVMTSKLKINTYCSKQLREMIITLRLCNSLKSKHEENEVIFLRLRLPSHMQ
uniref:Uncharacterized protein n=1 Tax=Tanacetum cinerariifolium TaxID=118510 RepID=A0A6L2JWS9_TANCI|nr:hypothetical protein [Tanacetum cinerariifolium]